MLQKKLPDGHNQKVLMSLCTGLKQVVQWKLRIMVWDRRNEYSLVPSSTFPKHNHGPSSKIPTAKGKVKHYILLVSIIIRQLSQTLPGSQMKWGCFSYGQTFSRLWVCHLISVSFLCNIHYHPQEVHLPKCLKTHSSLTCSEMSICQFLKLHIFTPISRNNSTARSWMFQTLWAKSSPIYSV